MSSIKVNQINEQVLKSCHDIYTKKDTGLCTLAGHIDPENKNINLLVPRKKISILLIGNHSAGKSSWINWYIDEHIQKTGVAIETQGFTVVTSGKKRESLTGNATLHLYPHFRKLCERVPHVLDHLSTEVSTSKSKKFPLVNLIDSPGLVDGEMKYPFEINEAILWWAGLVDLVFVFFDPIGQALCKRTLDICESMAENGYREKMRFYLSKADEAGHEADRQRVMMQVVQELCKRPSLNTHSFDMPTIYVPTLNSNRSKCVNQLDVICQEIESTINLTIQNTLNQLQDDCKLLSTTIDQRLDADSEILNRNFNRSLRKFGWYSLASLPFIYLILAIVLYLTYENLALSYLGVHLREELSYHFLDNNYIFNLSRRNQFYLILMTLVFYLLGKYTTIKSPVLSKPDKLRLSFYKKLLREKIVRQKEYLYQEYLQQSVSAGEM